ncbi:MAG TPA: extracellular solute-binding protein [Candidatus Paceibacterota bacterium]|nr:extracellular solute-binding protein [Candidatus Paceibacterota bacterium]
MKPFQVGVLVAFGLIALVSLFLFANFKGFGNNVEDIGAVVIWGTVPAKSITPGLNELKRLHKEYGKVTYQERSAQTFETDLASAIAAGAGPDLILINQEHLVAEKPRLTVIPSSVISERAFRDSYLPIFDLYLASGGTYGIPFLVDPLVLYYNRVTLATLGVAAAPATWEAVTGLAPSLARMNSAQTIEKSAIALGSYGNIENARSILSLLFLQTGQGITAESGGTVRSTLLGGGAGATGVTGTESALNFYAEFANPAKTTYSWSRSFPSARQEFVEGDTALYLGYASERSGLAAANPNLDFDMAAAPQPGTATFRTTYARAYAFALPKASKNPKGALSAALALSGRDVLPTAARGAGMAPSARSLLVPSNADLYEAVYYPEALAARAWLSPAPPATDRVFATMMDNVNSGRMSVKQALVAADQALNAALAP